MAYRVIRYFTDLQDHEHPYKAGDKFPRKGLTVSRSRIVELSTSENRQGVPLIEAVKIEKEALPINAPEPEPIPVPAETEKPAVRKRKRKAKTEG